MDDDVPDRWRDVPKVVNELSREVIGEAIGVHRDIGPGILENPYKLVLARRLERAGHAVEIEKALPLKIDGLVFEVAYRADIVVDGVLVIETKSVREVVWADVKQVKTYLALGRYPLGLIFNFRTPLLYQGGITRVVP